MNENSDDVIFEECDQEKILRYWIIISWIINKHIFEISEVKYVSYYI